MCSTNEVFLGGNVREFQSRLDVGDFQHTDHEKFVKNDDVFVDENGVYNYIEPHCSCGSRNVVRLDSNKKQLVNSETGEWVEVRIKKYRCKDCGIISQVEIEGYDKYCNYSNEFKEKLRKINGLRHIPLRLISYLLNLTNNIKISHETIRLNHTTTNELYWKNNDLKSSGYCGYDAQWFPIDSEWKYLHVLYDINEKQPIALEVTDTETKKDIKNFIDKSIKKHERKAIVTDLKIDYRDIMHNLGFDQQLCEFHFIQNLSKKIKEQKNIDKNNLKIKLKKENKNLSNHKLNKKADKILKDTFKHYDKCKAEIIEVFNQDSYEKAIEYIEELKIKSIEYPDFLRKYLHNEFFPIYKNYIMFLKEEYKDKLDNTNNQTEGYIGFGAEKSEKRKYRTKHGFFNHIVARALFWIENQKSKLTK